MTGLCDLDTTALGYAFRAGTATPEAVLEAHLDRLAQVDPLLHAMAWVDADGARAASRDSTARWRAGQPLSLLDGVPCTIKDNIPVAGLPCRWGSRLYADYLPPRDESPVARLRAAGAVIVGKTAVPEFTLQGCTCSPLTGVTRNPWDLALTPGGSSGGAVAALAAGVGAFAVGTDGGGSIRRPAGFTGLYGFKPGRDVVPRSDGLPEILPGMEVIGPLTRSARDLPRVLATLAGGDLAQFATPQVHRPLRIAYWREIAASPVDPDVLTQCDQAAERLRALGHAVRVCEAPPSVQAFNQQAWPVISTTGLAYVLRPREDLPLLTPPLADMLARGRAWLATDLFAAQAVVRALARAMRVQFQDDDLIMTPTSAAMPWQAELAHPSQIAAQGVDGRGHAVFTAFANAVGLPAVALPAGHAGHLPVGFQLVGPAGSDALLLGMAQAWAAAYPPRERAINHLPSFASTEDSPACLTH